MLGALTSPWTDVKARCVPSLSVALNHCQGSGCLPEVPDAVPRRAGVQAPGRTGTQVPKQVEQGQCWPAAEPRAPRSPGVGSPGSGAGGMSCWIRKWTAGPLAAPQGPPRFASGADGQCPGCDRHTGPLSLLLKDTSLWLLLFKNLIALLSHNLP